MNYFTSDLHFLHKNIITYNRPYYTSVREMNESIIAVINATVEVWDTLYILGDIALGSVKIAAEYLEQIKCEIKIVPGNHDSGKALKRYAELTNVEVLPPLYETKVGDTNVVMCHFPMVSWNRSHYGAWHLFGHTHGSYVGLGKSLDVGWDSFYNMYGVVGIFSEQDLRDIMGQKEFIQVSHHKEGGG
jgi:calcineurin-like phosphoesterase family protein